MSKPSVHIIHDKTFKTSEEAVKYANERGLKITHIEKYFMKGAYLFNYKFTNQQQKSDERK